MCTKEKMCACRESAEFWRGAFVKRCDEGTQREIEWTNRATEAEQALNDRQFEIDELQAERRQMRREISYLSATVKTLAKMLTEARSEKQV
jgi:chromosome segregation ATPase